MILINLSNLRPGVYSSYSVSSRYGTPRSNLPATLVINLTNLPENSYAINSFARAKELLGGHSGNKTALCCCQLLFELGVSVINLVDYGGSVNAAIENLEPVRELGMIIADVPTDNRCGEFTAWVEEQCKAQREALCFFARDILSEAVSCGEAVNHERGVVCYPAVSYQSQRSALFTACGLAGRILVENRPNYNLNGVEIPNVGDCAQTLESDVQKLLTAGVCVFEEVGGTVQCVRGITTRTTIDGTLDYSMRGINTVLIIDDVMRTVRGSLKNKLKGSGGAISSLDSIASQVLIELAAKEQQGVIESFQLPRVSPLSGEPTVCVVELAFNVAHVIGQIYITAHIGI